MLAQIQPVCVVRLNILVISSTCNGKAVLGLVPSPRRHKVVHLALQFAACYGELRNLVDGGVDFGADISDAQVIALKDQAHAPQ